MKQKEITIYGSVPSKKNSRNIFSRGGRIVNIPQKNYKIWHEESSIQLLGLKPVENIHLIHLIFYAKDRRKFDLTNKAESVMDLLVDNKIIEDDNCYVVPNTSQSFGGVDKQNPRCEIIIKYRNNENEKST